MSLRMELPDDALVDAHVHSVASDGALTLRQLANLARRSGLAAVVPCDHDVIHDSQELDDAGASAGIFMPHGVELTVAHNDRTLHLLAYGFDPRNGRLLDAVTRRQEQRRKRWNALSTAIARKSLRVDPRRLERIGAGKAPGRRHLARELVFARLATSIKNAFDRHLHGLQHDYIDDDPLEVADAIALVHSAGGKAVLAHPPANLTVGDWRRLAASGLDAIETGFPRVAKNHGRFLQERIAEYDFASTAGSDYHGDEPRDHLGCRTMTWKAFSDLLMNRPSSADGEP